MDLLNLDDASLGEAFMDDFGKAILFLNALRSRAMGDRETVLLNTEAEAAALRDQLAKFYRSIDFASSRQPVAAKFLTDIDRGFAPDILGAVKWLSRGVSTSTKIAEDLTIEDEAVSAWLDELIDYANHLVTSAPIDDGVSAKQLAEHVPCHDKVIRKALTSLRPVVQASGKNGGHRWHYSEAVEILKEIQTGKLKDVSWPDSASKLKTQKHSSEIPAKRFLR